MSTPDEASLTDALNTMFATQTLAAVLDQLTRNIDD